MQQKYWRGIYDFISRKQCGCFPAEADSAESISGFWFWLLHHHEQKAFAECSVLRFDTADEAWLDFVSDNRSGNYEGKTFDFIFGPVANDDVYTTFTLYTAGALTKEQTLEALKIKKLYNQLVLTSEKALSYLKFIGIVPEGEF